MSLSIKEAGENDSPLIRELASRIWEHTYRAILSKEQLGYMFEMMYSVEHIIRQMTELHHRYFIVCADSEPVGYLSIEKETDDKYIFQKIYVVPEFHGKGVGGYLFKQGVEYLKTVALAPFTVELYVNRANPSVGFYEHLGMKKTATRDYDIGNGFFMNDFIMTIIIE
ncbi:MAG: GNAT family N-acetyltransferase [Tannerella sp.]|jgi:GNAT superfamily N-acetyltransferase|nr:GNAT family N-acetyltransferase [Tannerella sp.]